MNKPKPTSTEQILLDGLAEIKKVAVFYGNDTVERLTEDVVTKFQQEKERIANIPPY